jgi:hypothetical protein
MRPKSHLILTEHTLKFVKSLNPDERAGILVGARDADTMLGDITLAHYFDGRTDQGPALNNIMHQLKKNTPLAMGVACHLIQDVALPVHAAPQEFLRHFVWEGYIDRNIETLVGRLSTPESFNSYQLDLYGVCQEIARRSSSLLGDMVEAWATDKAQFADICCECLALGDSGSYYILTNWNRF